jgi:hypothetical protein
MDSIFFPTVYLPFSILITNLRSIFKPSPEATLWNYPKNLLFSVDILIF